MASHTLTYSPEIHLPPLMEASVFVLVFDLVASAAHIDSLRWSLSTDEIARAEAFHFQRDTDQYVTTRGILRHLLSKWVDVTPGDIVFEYNAAGKPSLKGEAIGMTTAAEDHLHFNVSHSRDLALLAFARGLEIGADIEAKRLDLSRIDLLAGACLGDEDLKRFLVIDEHEKRDAFFRFWTRKEALLKAIGLGLGHPVKSFDVSYLDSEPAKLVRSDETIGDADAWSLQDVEVAPEYQASVAFRSRDYKVRQLRREEFPST